MLLIMKWIFVPYLLCVLYAMIGNKEILGNTLIEEYLVVMAFLIIIDVQRIAINVFHKIRFKD